MHTFSRGGKSYVKITRENATFENVVECVKSPWKEIETRERLAQSFSDSKKNVCFLQFANLRWAFYNARKFVVWKMHRAGQSRLDEGEKVELATEKLWK